MDALLPLFMNAQNAAARPETAHNCGVAGSFNWFSSRPERPIHPISKARVQGWETGSTFCSRRPDQQSAILPAEGRSLQIESSVRTQGVYLTGREPEMRMSTNLLALCCQSGPDATWETPISARSRSNGSRSLRMSPLLIARLTKESIAPWI